MVLPNLLARLGLQILIANTHVNAALERLVKCLNAIRRQEQNALVILRKPQEHGYEAVAVDIVGLPGFEEHIGFVEEQDGAPGMCNVHDTVEVLFEAAGVRAEFAGGHGVERAVEVFGDGFTGQCFTDAWGAVEDDIEPLAFALDYVVDGFGGVEAVGTDEAFEVGFDTVGENEGFKGFGVPFDLVNT
jgi:hypothetical protein